MNTTIKMVDTVTISLERYKQLEDIERSINEGYRVAVGQSYYSGKSYTFLSETDAIKQINKDVLSINQQLSGYRIMQEKLNCIENSFWFAIVKRFITGLNRY